MSIAANQQRTFLRLVAGLRPHWRRDPALPARIQALFARHREFGARDRRLYRELMFTTVRYLPWIEPMLDTDPGEATRRVAWLAAETPATRVFRATFAMGDPPTGDKAELLPGWFRPHCPAIFQGAELAAQLRRAPLWLRLQTDAPAAVFEEFSRRGWAWRASDVIAGAIQLLAEADVTTSEAWRNGLDEVQDLGSQMILESIGVERGGRWLDACTGAGGKTLQLARLLGPGGAIDAHDVRASALDELRTRTRRASHVCHLIDDKGDRTAAQRKTAIRIVRADSSRLQGNYDGVLVDAPCSGSGTWRRAPHLKWVTTDEAIVRAAATQRTLLAQYSSRVKPGGRLVYATCSLSARENEDVVNTFLTAHPEFRPEPFVRNFGAMQRSVGLLILPAQHDTDGFFVASLRRR